MSDANKDNAIDISQQLLTIQEQLNQFAIRFDNIENQLKEVSNVSERISQLEDRFMLVADSYRYKKLQEYLADRNWFEADIETIQLILKVTGKELEDLSPEDIQHFPCNDLMVIDRLWLKYSDRHFGFSVQLETYQAIGGSFDTTIEQNRQIVEKWGERLGWREGDRWRKCSELDYSLNAPKGSQPARWWNSPYGSKMTNFFLGRLMKCEILSN